MHPHERLLAWLQTQDNRRQLELFGSVFAAGATLDGELSPCETVLGAVEGFAALEEVRPVTLLGNATGGVVVFEAQDSVTELRHRCSWVVQAVDGLIVHVV